MSVPTALRTRTYAVLCPLCGYRVIVERTGVPPELREATMALLVSAWQAHRVTMHPDEQVLGVFVERVTGEE